MTLTKNILSLLLVLLVCISVKAETSGDGWVLSDDGVLTISADIEYSYYSSYPWYSSCTKVTSVALTEDVTKIGKDAFCGQVNLSKVIVDKSNKYFSSKDGLLLSKDGTELVYWPQRIYGDISIPSGITSIASYAFYKNPMVFSVQIPEGVVSIGESAFYSCDYLVSVSLPSTLTSLGKYSFEFCKKLKSITIPESVTSIGYGAFYECSGLTGDLIIPESVTSLGDYAFYKCSGLTSVTIPSSIVDWGSFVFSNCTNIKNVILQDGLQSIGGSAFSDCSSLTSITIPESVTSIERYAFSGCSSLTSISLPSNLTSINSSLFMRCENLQSITIPESVTIIDEQAFWGCTALTDITIHKNVTKIGYQAFHGCSSLSAVYVDEQNQKFLSDDGVLYNKDKTTLILCPPSKSGEFVVPDGVTEINSYAFDGCSNLTSISIPASVNNISDFEGGSSLSAINVDESNSKYKSVDGVLYEKYEDYGENGETIISWYMVRCPQNKSGKLELAENTIGLYSEAIRDCNKLTSIAIPEGITTIGSWYLYFTGCSSLEEIIIPASAEEIDFSEFSDCTQLTTITVDENNEYYSSYDGVVLNKDKTEVIYCPRAKSGSYTIPNTVVSINENAFNSCINLVSVTIPEGVTSIGNSAFYECTGLESIVIPESVTSIGSYAFIRSGLKSVDIPKNVEEIGYAAFATCTNLLYFNVDEANLYYKSVDGVLFNKDMTTLITCPPMKSGKYNIPESVTEIGDMAFSYCDKLTGELYLSDNIEEISVAAFNHCSGFTSVKLPQNINRIHQGTFWNCSGLSGELVIPENVEGIDSYAFNGCSNLTSVTIPAKVRYTDYDAFGNCTSLTSIAIQNSSFGSKCFENSNNLKYIFLYQEQPYDLTNFPSYQTAEMIFVKYHLLDYYRIQYPDCKFTGFSLIGEDLALSLEKGSYDFIMWLVNSGEKLLKKEISLVLTKDRNVFADDEGAAITWESIGTAEHPFKGTFDGQGHSIIFDNAKSEKPLFGYIGENAEVRNLVVEDINVEANDDIKVVDDETTYYPILAVENRGLVKNSIVRGYVSVDEDAVDVSKAIACLVVDNYGTLDHMVHYYGNAEEDGNKRNIVILQNMGVGRYAGQTKKVCNNRKKKKKSLSATPSSDVNNDIREYTDEEMASGEPAYWLNYAGKGYTGDYTSEWSKGKMHPIMATELSKPAVKIVYDIDGATESEAGLINPLFFANEDDEIEIETAVAPEKVWLGNNVAEELNSKTKLTKKLLSSAAKDGIITVHLMYSKATGIESAKAEKSIRVNGHAISIEGAEGESYSIVDVMGRTVAEGECSKELKTIVVPASGIYIVKAGETFKKIIVR